MDGVTNKRLAELGQGLGYYPGVPELFDEIRSSVLGPEHQAAGVTVDYYIISSGLKALLEGSPGSTILIVQVVGVFPNITAENGRAAFHQRGVLVRRAANA